MPLSYGSPLLLVTLLSSMCFTDQDINYVVLRRLNKKIYIPLPDAATRRALISTSGAFSVLFWLLLAVDAVHERRLLCVWCWRLGGTSVCTLASRTPSGSCLC
jgi:hypothetical protein